MDISNRSFSCSHGLEKLQQSREVVLVYIFGNGHNRMGKCPGLLYGNREYNEPNNSCRWYHPFCHWYSTSSKGYTVQESFWKIARHCYNDHPSTSPEGLISAVLEGKPYILSVQKTVGPPY